MRKILVFLFLVLVSISNAQESKLRVASDEFAPFVIGSEGFDLDLLREVSSKMGKEIEIIPSGSMNNIMELVRNNNVDIGSSAISIKSDREEFGDFSVPYYNSGLGIMIEKPDKQPLLKVLYDWGTKERIRVVIFFFAWTFIAGFLIWLSELGTGEFSKNPLKGIPVGIEFAIVTSSTVGYGNRFPKRWIGRLLAMLLIVTGVPFFGFVVGTFAAVSFSNSGNIQDILDLKGENVAVVSGTTSETFSHDKGLNIIRAESDEEAYQFLKDGKVKAVINDLPALKYAGSKNENFLILDKVYEPQSYGFFFRENFEYLEEFNTTLLKVMESNYYAELLAKYGI